MGHEYKTGMGDETGAKQEMRRLHVAAPKLIVHRHKNGRTKETFT